MRSALAEHSAGCPLPIRENSFGIDSDSDEIVSALTQVCKKNRCRVDSVFFFYLNTCHQTSPVGRGLKTFFKIFSLQYDKR
jgi:hypothetical protein